MARAQRLRGCGEHLRTSGFQMQCSMVWALQRIEKEKPAAGKTDYWRDFWRSGWDSNPRNLAVQLISSQSRYPDFVGKRRKLTDNARVCKPLKKQHFSAIESRKSRKPRQGKEFERNPVLGRKKPVGEKMGRTRGEITVQCR